MEQKDTERLYAEIIGLTRTKLNLTLSSIPRLVTSAAPLVPHTALLDPAIVALGTYYSGTNTITVCIYRHYDEVAATIMHELMHAYLFQEGIRMEVHEDEEGICELMKIVLYNKLLGEQALAEAFIANNENFKWPFLKAKRAFRALNDDFTTFLSKCKLHKRLDKI